jgi:cysteine sulfinate desulfinase/cysteine desulfurase-like protein
MTIYLDHNAGAPLRPQVRDAFERLLSDGLGNPASVHRSGQGARKALEEARHRVASLIAADSRRVIFTSGGTESNNLAIRGSLSAMAPAGRRGVVTSAIEHSSILAPINDLDQRETVRTAPDADGRIDPEAVVGALNDRTALVSLGLANAEVGTIANLAALAGPIASAGALFHIDAAQALGKIPIRVDSLGCDLMTLSGHKLGAPAGIGALYVRESRRLSPVMRGGPQESGLRAGTPNLFGAVGFGAAVEEVKAHLDEEAARIAAMADLMLTELASAIPGLRLNGPPLSSSAQRLANTLNLTFPGVLGESMLIALDLEGVEVSMGSACAAGAVEPSHVLLAMGRSAVEARSSLRISLGWNNSAGEIESAAATIARVWQRVRAAEPVAAEARS